MATSTVLTNKPINPRGDDNRPVDSYNRAALYSGKALDFDGVNDYVAIAYDASTRPTSEITLTAIAKMDWSSSTQTRILSCTEAGGYNISVGEGSFIPTGNTGMLLRLSSSGYTAVYISNTTIPDGYNAISSTFDGRYLKLYLNGTLVATTDSGETQSIYYAYNNSLFVGAEASSGATPAGSGYWNGEISNVRVFNTALTATQVSDLYNNPEKVVPTGVDNTALKLWLPMMEGAGTTAYDGSGNGNHGTISGATYVNGVGAPVAQSAVMDWNKLYDFDGVDDKAYNAIYQDTTGTKSYKVHFIAHDVNSEGQIFQIFNFSASKGVGATIDFLGTNNGTLGMRGFVSNSDYNIQSWNVEANTYYELAFTINWDTNTIVSATLNGENATGSVSARIDTSIGGLFLGGRNTQYYLNGIINYFEVVGDEKWTNASGFKSESGSYDMTITGSPSQILAPQGLTSGRDITGVNLFENVRKQGALNLDGNSWAEVHDNASLDLTTGVSVEAWVYWGDEGVSDGIIGKGGDYLLYVSASKYAQFYINGSYGTNAYLLGTNTGWYHIVGTYDGTSQKIYINGSLENTQAKTGSINLTNKVLDVGRYNSSSGTEYANQIAQPRIYNRALTASEVLNNYNATKDLYI